MKKIIKLLIILVCIISFSFIKLNFLEEKEIYANNTKEYLVKENIISNIELKTTKLEFQNRFETSGTMSLNCNSSSNYVGSSCDFKVIKDNEEIIYKTLVQADVTSDGLASLIDIAKIVNNAYEKEKFSNDILKKASDMNFDNKYNKEDAKLLASILLENKTVPFKEVGKGVAKVKTNEVNLKAGQNKTIDVVLKSKSVTIKSATTENDKVATIDTSGKITAVGNGSTNVKVVFTSDDEATIKVNVTTDQTGINISKSDDFIGADKDTFILNYIGSSKILTAEVSPATASNKEYTWSSSNPSVATIDSSGLVTAVGVGEATITASTGKVSASVKVNVENKMEISMESLEDDKVLLAGEDVSYKLVSSTSNDLTLTSNGIIQVFTQDPLTYELVPYTGSVSFKDNIISFKAPTEINDLGLLRVLVRDGHIKDSKGNVSTNSVTNDDYVASLNLNYSVPAGDYNNAAISAAVGVDNSYYVKDYTYYIKEKGTSEYKLYQENATYNGRMFRNDLKNIDFDIVKDKTYVIKVDVEVYTDRFIGVETSEVINGDEKTVINLESTKTNTKCEPLKYTKAYNENNITKAACLRKEGTNDCCTANLNNNTVVGSIEKEITLDSSKVSDVNIKFFEVEGDSIFIQYNGKNILIDTGYAEYAPEIINVIKNNSANNTCVIHHFISTHNHGDHTGGNKIISENCEIENYYSNGNHYEWGYHSDPQVTTGNSYYYPIFNTDYYKRRTGSNSTINEIISKNIKYNVLQAGNVVNIDGLIFNVLFPYNNIEMPYYWLEDDCDRYNTESIIITKKDEEKGTSDTKLYKYNPNYGVCLATSYAESYGTTITKTSNGQGIRTPIPYKHSFKYCKSNGDYREPKELINSRIQAIKEGSSTSLLRYYHQSSYENEGSIVMKMNLGNSRMLLTGDSQFRAEEIMMGIDNDGILVNEAGEYTNENGIAVNEAGEYLNKEGKPNAYTCKKIKYTEQRTSLVQDLIKYEKRISANTNVSESLINEEYVKEKYGLNRFTQKNVYANVMKKGHHYVPNSGSIEFYRTVSPSTVVISAPKQEYGNYNKLSFIKYNAEYNLYTYFKGSLSGKVVAATANGAPALDNDTNSIKVLEYKTRGTGWNLIK